MTPEALVAAIRGSSDGGALGELRAELERGAASHDSTGELLSHEAAATWRIRRWTSERGGLDAAGFAETVSALEKQPRGARIELSSFTAPGQLFMVFAAGDRLLGCIRVNRREPPPRRAGADPSDP
jgi:hypothetical protein